MEPAVPFTVRARLPGWAGALGWPLDAITGLARLQRMYGPVAGASDFPAAALDALGIGVRVAPEDLSCVPADGPLVIVANHPHGAADGLALVRALRVVRPDLRLLGNDLVARIGEMRDHVVAIDVFRDRTPGNASALRRAVEWVRQGHALAIFPAGEVSHVRTGDGRIVDGAWKDGAARIAARAGAPVLPLFIAGRNSAGFVAAGRLHPALRTALLPRELLRLRGSTIRVHAGRPVSRRRLDALGDAATQTAYLRVRSYGLPAGAGGATALRRARRMTRPAPIAPAAAAEQLAAEIERLPSRARLLAHEPWQVFYAEAADIPLTLQEIGRLREAAFRNAGEGTGRPRDLDGYDSHYGHLFVWHRQRQAVAGAYRIARTDRIGARGLYTRTLFRYRSRLLGELGPALELGRSFVALDFQREYQPLLLLWRGIGSLIAAEPRYRRLFGPVSISADYGSVTRQILARFLIANRYRADLGALVRPRRPLVACPHDAPDALVRSAVAARLEEVDEIVRDLEAGQRGMPVLLRQYLKLNAQLLGFSVDPAFGHVLDGLVVVDLLDVDRALLTRYLGTAGAERFLAWHADRQPPPPLGEPTRLTPLPTS